MTKPPVKLIRAIHGFSGLRTTSADLKEASHPLAQTSTMDRGKVTNAMIQLHQASARSTSQDGLMLVSMESWQMHNFGPRGIQKLVNYKENKPLA